jgi:hypothetical protein
MAATELVRECMRLLGAASALSHGKTLALESGMSEEEWDGLEPALKKEWVSEAMSALGSMGGSIGGTVSTLSQGKTLALESGMSEEEWDGLEPALKKEWVSGAMTASGSTGGAASAFQRGKKHALDPSP